MFKFIRIAFVVLLAFVAAVLVIASTKPSTFRVERSVTIHAQPAAITPLIDDFHQWGRWSPWAKLDPNMKVAYSGAPSGPGAVYEWEGNSSVGKGRMEILSAGPTRTSVRLDFLKPFEGHNTADFTLTPQPNGDTRLTWSMYGPMAFFPGKVMSVFLSMDRMIGPDFEHGLVALKAAAESH